MASNSPTAEAGDDEDVYVVKRILAEAGGDEDKVFLIEWEGYDIEESTWEPEGNVFSRETLKTWEDEKLRQREGLSEQYDLDEFERLKEVYDRRKQERAKKEVREKKQKQRRKRLGFLPSQRAKSLKSESEEYISSEEAEEDDDAVQDYEGIPQPKKLRHTQVKQPQEANPPCGIMNPFGIFEDDAPDPTDAPISERRRALNPAQQPARDANHHREEAEPRNSIIEQQVKTQKPPIIEAPSATGYQGTANRATRSHSAIEPKSQSLRRKSRMTRRGSLMPMPKPRGQRSIQDRILKEAPSKEVKAPQLFSTKSLERKFELAARSLADRAPAQVPRLINPAVYANQRIRKRGTSVISKEPENSQPPPTASASVDSQPTPSSTVANIESAQLLFRPDEDDSWSLFEEPEELHPQQQTTTVEAAKSSPGQAGEERQEPPQTRKVSFALQDTAQDKPSYVTKQAEQSCSRVLPPEPSPAATSHSFVFDKPPPPEPSHFPTSIPVYNHPVNSQIQEPPVDLPTTQVRKVTLADYSAKQNGLTQSPFSSNSPEQGDSNGVTLKSFFGDGQVQNAPIMLKFLNVNAQDKNWESIVREFNKFSPTLLARGRVVAAATDDKADQESIRVIADYLRASISGLLHNLGALNIVIYPTRCEDWKFIEVGVQIQQRDQLSFFAFTTSSDIVCRSYNKDAENIMSKIKIDEPEDYHILNEEVFGYSYQSLLPFAKKGPPDVFFLLFPNMTAPLAEHTIAWLRHCNKDCKIFTCQQAGSWLQFVKTTVHPGAGSLIIHDKLISLFPRYPKFQQFLQNGMNNVWCVDESFRDGKFLSRLYPQGGAVCLTSEFLIAEPEVALHFLNWFYQKVSRASTGTWKLFVCHDIYKYVSDQAIYSVKRREMLLKSLPSDLSNYNKEILAANDGLSAENCHHRFLVMDAMDRLLHFKVNNETELDAMLQPDKSRYVVAFADESIHSNDDHGLVSYFAFWSAIELKSFRKFIAIGSKATTKHKDNLGGLPQGRSSTVVGNLQTQTALAPMTLNSASPKLLTEVPRIQSLVSKGSKQEHAILATVDGANDEHEAESLQNDERRFENDRKAKSSTPGGSTTKPQLELTQTSVASAPTNTDVKVGKSDDMEIDVHTDPQILRFITKTGSTISEAIEFIRRAQGDVDRAVNIYKIARKAKTLADAASADTHNDTERLRTPLLSHANEVNPTHLDTTDIAMEDAPMAAPEAVLSDLLSTGDTNASTNQISGTKATPRASKEPNPTDPDTTDVVMENAPEAVPSDLLNTNDPSAPTNGSSEPQTTTKPSNAGIVTSETGERSVPSSVRMSGTVRNPLNIRPGYVPPEDKEGYKVRRDGTPRLGSEPMSRSTSGSRSDEGKNRAVVDGNTSVSPASVLSSVAATGRGKQAMEGVEETRSNVERVKSFNTLEWYAERKRKGQEWHHIAVVGWEDAFKLLRIEYKK